MLFTVIFLIFLFLVARGFVRTVVFFWDWLSGGDRLPADHVERAEAALEESEDVLERELARAQGARGLGRLFARWRASNEAVDEYLDHLSLGWYQVVFLFFLGSMAGLLIEEVWMLLTAGLTENRAGLVWGPSRPSTAWARCSSRSSASSFAAVARGAGRCSLSLPWWAARSSS